MVRYACLFRAQTFYSFCVCGWNGNEDFWYCHFSLFQAHYGVKKSQMEVLSEEKFSDLFKQFFLFNFDDIWKPVEIRGYRIFKPSPPEFLFFLQIWLSLLLPFRDQRLFSEVSSRIVFSFIRTSKWLKINSPHMVCQEHVFLHSISLSRVLWFSNSTACKKDVLYS